MRNLMVIVALASIPALALAAPVKKALPSRGVSKAPAVRTAPLFEFKGINTRESYPTPCTGPKLVINEDGTINCIDVSKVAGVLTQMLFSYHNSKLYGVWASFDSGGYDTMREALVAKYGPPHESETKKWQSKGGALFDNVVDNWEFESGGSLELESMGANVGNSRFTFVSAANAPTSPGPKVDF